mmetsp:Transcript_14997/g.23264  ORF Transcript_14997/g.23264 Transcript_14997/m.23264 type:complete len:91 (-) Transcript_14997:45-317(-)
MGQDAARCSECRFDDDESDLLLLSWLDGMPVLFFRDELCELPELRIPGSDNVSLQNELRHSDAALELLDAQLGPNEELLRRIPRLTVATI